MRLRLPTSHDHFNAFQDVSPGSVTRFKRLPWRAKFRRPVLPPAHRWLWTRLVGRCKYAGCFGQVQSAANRLNKPVVKFISNLAQGEGHDGELCKEESTQRLPPKSVMTPKQYLPLAR
jgi:hypothetical protein